MTNAIVGDALRTWTNHDAYLEVTSEGWDQLLELATDHSLGEVFGYQSQTIINYTLARRAKMISDWMNDGGEDGRSAEAIEALSPSVEDMIDLNEVVLQNNLHQVFKYLYVHAHLTDYLLGTGPLAAMVAIRDSIRRR